MIFPVSSEVIEEESKEMQKDEIKSEEYEDLYEDIDEILDDYDFYDEESAIQTLLLTNTEAPIENFTEQSKDKSKEEILQEIEAEAQEENPILRLIKKRQRLRQKNRPHSTLYRGYGQRING